MSDKLKTLDEYNREVRRKYAIHPEGISCPDCKSETYADEHPDCIMLGMGLKQYPIFCPECGWKGHRL